MKNRLEIARKLLRDDGFIAIAIDHAELFYLGVLADEVFGRENRLGIISVVHHPAGKTNDKFFSTTNEYMIVYSKYFGASTLYNFPMTEKIEKTFNLKDDVSKYKLVNIMRKGATRNARREDRPKQFYPIYVNRHGDVSLESKNDYDEIFPVENGVEWVWSFSPSTLQSIIDADGLVVKRDESKCKIFSKNRITDYPGMKPRTVWDHKTYNATQHGTNLLKKLFGRSIFSYPKSLYAVKDTLKITTEKNDIILDFFAGSGTTAHAVLALNKEDGGNRQFILVEQLAEHIAVCQERISKVIQADHSGVDFVYCELKQYNQKFIDDIKAAKTTESLLDIWGEMKFKSFLDYNLDIKKQDSSMAEFKQLPLDEQKQHLVEILDKNQMYVNLSSLDDADHQCTPAEKSVTRDFYQTEK